MAANPRLCPRCGSPLAPVSGRPGRWACQPCGLGFSVRGRKSGAPAPTRGDPRLLAAVLVGGVLAVVLLGLIAAITLVVLHPAGWAAAPKPVAAAPASVPPEQPDPAPAPTATPNPPPTPPPDPKPAPPPDPKPAPPPTPPPDPVPTPTPPTPAAAPTPTADPAVNTAIDKGVKYLKRCVNGVHLGPQTYWISECQGTGFFSLIGLALLESGVPKNDPAVAKAVAAVRAGAADTHNTYEIGTCLWFLNRLDDRQDDDLMRELATRLLAGQNEYGSWNYVCPTLGPDKQRELLEVLAAYDPSVEIPGRKRMIPACSYKRGMSLQAEQAAPVSLLGIGAALAGGPSAGRPGDPSLTQFAVLGLWVARKHQVPVDRSLLMAEAYARAIQEDDGGWSYRQGLIGSTDAMTCAGLMDLTVGRGVGETEGGKVRGADLQFEKGIWYLSDIYDRGGATAAAKASINPAAPGDAYATLRPLTAALLGHALQGQRTFWKKDLTAFQTELDRCLASDPPADAKKDLQQIADQIKQYHDAPGDKVTQEKAALVKRIQQSPAGRGVAAAGAASGLLLVNPDNPESKGFLKPSRSGLMNTDDIYTLWSMERLAMVCDLKTVAGHDWYAWARTCW